MERMEIGLSNGSKKSSDVKVVRSLSTGSKQDGSAVFGQNNNSQNLGVQVAKGCYSNECKKRKLAYKGVDAIQLKMVS